MVTKNNKDNGFTSILYAVGAKPLDNWEYVVKNGHIKRLLDPDIQSPSIEIIGANVDANFIYTPTCKNKSLEIKMPTIVLLIKNLLKYYKIRLKYIEILVVFLSDHFHILNNNMDI